MAKIVDLRSKYSIPEDRNSETNQEMNSGMEKYSGSKEKKRKIISKALFIVIIAGVIFGGYKIAKNKIFTGQKNQPAQANITITPEEIISKVGKLIILPTNEVPAVYSIPDVNKLAKIPFFKSAKNGDYVLVFLKNQKAVLYDPKENVIVEITSSNQSISSPSQPQQNISSTTKPVNSSTSGQTTRKR